MSDEERLERAHACARVDGDAHPGLGRRRAAGRGAPAPPAAPPHRLLRARPGRGCRAGRRADPVARQRRRDHGGGDRTEHHDHRAHHDHLDVDIDDTTTVPPPPARPENAIWPFPGGAHVPETPARPRCPSPRFYLRMPDPTVDSTSLSARVVEVRARRDRPIVTSVTVEESGGEWFVTGARTRNIDLVSPEPGDRVSSPGEGHRHQHGLRGPGELGGPGGERRARDGSWARASSWAAPTGEFGPFDAQLGLRGAHPTGGRDRALHPLRGGRLGAGGHGRPGDVRVASAHAKDPSRRGPGPRFALRQDQHRGSHLRPPGRRADGRIAAPASTPTTPTRPTAPGA